jgi:hypothetical protein
MGSRLLSWILLLYLTVDLANPFLPGAFTFTAEEGCVWVEAMPHTRYPASSGPGEAREPGAAPRLRRSDGERPRAAGSVQTRDVVAWLAAIRTGDPPARDLPPPQSDDH